LSEIELKDEWAIVELMGHRRLAGRVTGVTVAGAPFLRIDVPSSSDVGDPQLSATQLYAPAAVYAITPTTEEVVRRCRVTPTPVQQWELRAGPAIDEYPGADDTE